MGMLSGLILLASFGVMLYYLCRGGSIFVGLSLTGLFWVVVAGMPFHSILSNVLQAVVENIAPTIMLMILGSWLGQVLVQTGIVATLIRRTVELGGDRPLVVATLVSIVTGFIFTAVFGVGGAIAIGVIAFPVLISLGIPPWLATASFTTAIGAAMPVNIVNINLIVTFFTMAGVPKGAISVTKYLPYGFVFFALFLLADIAMLAYYIKYKKVLQTAWATRIAEVLPPLAKEAPWYSLITPAIPIIMIMAFHWPNVPAFLAAILIALLTTGRLLPRGGGVEVLQKTFHDGVSEIAGVMLAWMGIQVFVMAASKATPMLQPVLSHILPHSALGIALFFGLLTPLALYRGPLMVGGAGAALVGYLAAIGNLPLLLIFALAQIPSAYANGTCPTQSWTIWVIHYVKVPPLDHIRPSFVTNWIAAILGCLVAFYVFGR